LFANAFCIHQTWLGDDIKNALAWQCLQFYSVLVFYYFLNQSSNRNIKMKNWNPLWKSIINTKLSDKRRHMYNLYSLMWLEFRSKFITIIRSSSGFVVAVWSGSLPSWSTQLVDLTDCPGILTICFFEILFYCLFDIYRMGFDNFYWNSLLFLLVSFFE